MPCIYSLRSAVCYYIIISFKKVTKLFFNFFYIAHNRGAASS